MILSYNRLIDYLITLYLYMEFYTYGGLDKEKKKRVVKLICMVKGQKFEEKKEVEDFTISVDDIDLVLERAKKLRPKLYMEMTNE